METLKGMLMKLKQISPSLEMLEVAEQKQIARSIISLKNRAAEEEADDEEAKERFRQMPEKTNHRHAHGVIFWLVVLLAVCPVLDGIMAPLLPCRADGEYWQGNFMATLTLAMASLGMISMFRRL